MAIAAYPK